MLKFTTYPLAALLVLRFRGFSPLGVLSTLYIRDTICVYHTACSIVQPDPYRQVCNIDVKIADTTRLVCAVVGCCVLIPGILA